MAAAAAAARDRGAMDGIDGHFFMESRGHQGRIDPARVIVVAWTRHDGRGVKDTGAGRQGGHPPTGGGCDRRDSHEQADGAQRGEFAPRGRPPRLGDAHGSREAARRPHVRECRELQRHQHMQLRHVHGGPSSHPRPVRDREVEVGVVVVVRVRGRRGRVVVVVVMVPVVGMCRIRAVRVVATQRKRLATQSADGQQGRDQEECEEASNGQGHSGTVSPNSERMEGARNTRSLRRRCTSELRTEGSDRFGPPKPTQKATHFAPNAAQWASQHRTAPVRNASFGLHATPETQRGCAAQCERAQPRAFIPEWAILDSNQ